MTGLLFLVSFFCNASVKFMLAMKIPVSSNIPQSAYDLLMLPLASLIFFYALNGRYKINFIIVTTVVFCFILLNLTSLQREGINSYSKFANSFVVTCFCVFYFYRLMVELPATHLQRVPMFWICSGFLIYHAGTIFLFAFTPYLRDVLGGNLIPYWSFHNILSVIEHLIIVIGLVYDIVLLSKSKPLYKPGKNLSPGKH